jgi:hypothetical protein
VKAKRVQCDEAWCFVSVARAPHCLCCQTYDLNAAG